MVLGHCFDIYIALGLSAYCSAFPVELNCLERTVGRFGVGRFGVGRKKSEDEMGRTEWNVNETRISKMLLFIVSHPSHAM